MDETLRQARENGVTQAETWEEYVQQVADENDVDFEVAWSIFDLLGPNEAFDGFVSTIQDFADGL